MSLNETDVRWVSHLGRIHLTDQEVSKFAGQLGAILEHVKEFDALDLKDVEPMAHALDMKNVFREDLVRPSLPREEALANAPRSDGEFYIVPKVIQETGEA